VSIYNNAWHCARLLHPWWWLGGWNMRRRWVFIHAAKLITYWLILCCYAMPLYLVYVTCIDNVRHLLICQDNSKIFHGWRTQEGTKKFDFFLLRHDQTLLHCIWMWSPPFPLICDWREVIDPKSEDPTWPVCLKSVGFPIMDLSIRGLLLLWSCSCSATQEKSWNQNSPAILNHVFPVAATLDTLSVCLYHQREIR